MFDITLTDNFLYRSQFIDTSEVYSIQHYVLKFIDTSEVYLIQHYVLKFIDTSEVYSIQHYVLKFIDNSEVSFNLIVLIVRILVIKFDT